MRRALVTGSRGFVGSHMVEELRRRGWVVDGVDLADSIDAHQVFQSPITPRYDLVVHAAYHVGGRAAIDGINTNFSQNVCLDGAMFDWAIRTQQRRVLYFSSSAVYPIKFQTREFFTTHTRNLRESDVDFDNLMLPDKGYGWAKLTGECLAADAARNGLCVTVVRPSSGCSALQDTTYPFTAIAQRVARRESPLTVWGPPGQTRDFIHIDDVIGASLAVSGARAADPVNICTGVATTMGELASMMWKRMHGTIKGLTIAYDETKPTGVYRRVLDPTLMLNYYQPKFSMRDLVNEAAEAFGPK